MDDTKRHVDDGNNKDSQERDRKRAHINLKIKAGAQLNKQDHEFIRSDEKRKKGDEVHASTTEYHQKSASKRRREKQMKKYEFVCHDANCPKNEWCSHQPGLSPREKRHYGSAIAYLEYKECRSNHRKMKCFRDMWTRVACYFKIVKDEHDRVTPSTDTRDEDVEEFCNFIGKHEEGRHFGEKKSCLPEIKNLFEEYLIQYRLKNSNIREAIERNEATLEQSNLLNNVSRDRDPGRKAPIKVVRSRTFFTDSDEECETEMPSELVIHPLTEKLVSPEIVYQDARKLGWAVEQLEKQKKIKNEIVDEEDDSNPSPKKIVTVKTGAWNIRMDPNRADELYQMQLLKNVAENGEHGEDNEKKENNEKETEEIMEVEENDGVSEESDGIGMEEDKRETVEEDEEAVKRHTSSSVEEVEEAMEEDNQVAVPNEEQEREEDTSAPVKYEHKIKGDEKSGEEVKTVEEVENMEEMGTTTAEEPEDVVSELGEGKEPSGDSTDVSNDNKEQPDKMMHGSKDKEVSPQEMRECINNTHGNDETGVGSSSEKHSPSLVLPVVVPETFEEAEQEHLESMVEPVETETPREKSERVTLVDNATSSSVDQNKKKNKGGRPRKANVKTPKTRTLPKRGKRGMEIGDNVEKEGVSDQNEKEKRVIPSPEPASLSSFVEEQQPTENFEIPEEEPIECNTFESPVEEVPEQVKSAETEQRLKEISPSTECALLEQVVPIEEDMIGSEMIGLDLSTSVDLLNDLLHSSNPSPVEETDDKTSIIVPVNNSKTVKSSEHYQYTEDELLGEYGQLKEIDEPSVAAVDELKLLDERLHVVPENVSIVVEQPEEKKVAKKRGRPRKKVPPTMIEEEPVVPEQPAAIAVPESAVTVEQAVEEERVVERKKPVTRKRTLQLEEPEQLQPKKSTRNKRLYLSTNNPAPRVRDDVSSGASTSNAPLQPRITGVGNMSPGRGGTPEKLKLLPAAIRSFVEVDPIEEEEKETEKSEAIRTHAPIDDSSIKTEAIWEAPPPINELSRKSRKRQRLEKYIKKEDDGNVEPAECSILSANIQAIKQEAEDPDFRILSNRFNILQPVELEPEPLPYKMIDPNGKEKPTHRYIATKKLYESINSLFSTDPNKFSKLVLLLNADTERKGRVFKLSVTVDNRFSDFDPQFLAYLAKSKKHLTVEQEECTDFGKLSTALRNRASNMLHDHRLLPSHFHRVVKTITEIKNNIRENCPVGAFGDGERDTLRTAERILTGQYLDGILKMTGLSQITWTTDTHVKRRLEMVYNGWKMFLCTGGFFRLILALDRKDVQPIKEEFRKYCKEYLMEIEKLYQDAVKLAELNETVVVEALRGRAELSLEEVAALDEDVQGKASSTHTHSCPSCSIDHPVFFSSDALLDAHEKLHHSETVCCDNCFQDVPAMEYTFHRINEHFALRG